MALRRYDHEDEEAVTLQVSSVHILRTEEELREAVRRASEFERRTAEGVESRSRHYRMLVSAPTDRTSPKTDIASAPLQ